MSDKPRKGSGFPGAKTADDLLADFAAWDKNLDELFTEDESTADSRMRQNALLGAAAAAAQDAQPAPGDEGESGFSDAPAIDIDEIGDREDLDFLPEPQQALAGLPGPLPLPPLEEASEDETPAPFAEPREEDEADSVYTSAQRPAGRPVTSDPAAHGGHAPGDDDDDEIEEVTRVLEEDDDLLVAALRATQGPAEVAAPAGKPRVAPRRTATIVRREDLERRRRAMPPAEDLDEDDFGPETTRIADARQIESLMEAAAMATEAAPDGPEPPEITIAVDEEFYDDIVIGDEAEPPAPAQPPAAEAAPGRRVSPHLVRRDAIRPEAGKPDTGSGSMPALRPRSEDDADGGAHAGSPAIEVASASADALGRAVDPEITLDMRVIDANLLMLPDEALPLFEEELRRGQSPESEQAPATPDQAGEIAAARAPEPSPAAQAHEAAQAQEHLAGLGLDDQLEDEELEFELEAVLDDRTPVPGGEDDVFDRELDAAFAESEPALEHGAADLDRELEAAFADNAPVDLALDLEIDAAFAESVPGEPGSGDAGEGEPGESSDVEDNPPEVEFVERPPEVEFVERPPEVEFVERPPEVEFVERPPEVEFVERPPEVEFVERPPEVEVGDNPSGDEDGAPEVDAAPPALEPAPDGAGGLALPELADMPYDAGLPPAPGELDEPELDFSLPHDPDLAFEIAPELGESRVEIAAESGWSAPEITADLGDFDAQGELEEITRMRQPSVVAPLPVPGVLDGLDALGGLELAPDFPAPVLPEALPGLELDLTALPEVVADPAPGLDADELARDLALCERELEHCDDAAHAIQLRLEAGRLAEVLGDLDQARAHYEDALQGDPGMVPAMRALRRIERAAGHFTEAARYLEAELEEASDAERRALGALRVDMLMAAGEQDLARVAVGDILDREPADVRALLANLELAYVDGRDDELAEALERLARALEDAPLCASLHMLRGRLGERLASAGAAAPGPALAAYEQAAAAGSSAALVSMARVARRAGDAAGAASALGRIALTDLGERDPAHAAALHWRRARWTDDAEIRHQALHSAVTLSGHEPVLLAELARSELARGDQAAAAGVLLRLGESAAAPAEKASALLRAAGCLAALDQHDQAADALRRAVAIDPADPRATAGLARAFEAQGDIEALIALDRQALLADPAGAVFERVRVAQRLADMGRLDEAVAELEVGREAAAGSLALDEALAEILARAGQDEARVALLGALAEAGDERDPDAALCRAARAASAHAAALHARWCELASTGAGAGAPDAAPDAEALDVLDAARTRHITLALNLWHRALEIDPAWSEAHAACVRLAAMLGDADVSEDALSRAQAAVTDPGHAVTLALSRADLILAKGEPDRVRAEDVAREAASLAIEDPRPALRLLVLAAQDDRMADAAAVLEERAALSSGDPALALQYRAASLLLHGADDPVQAMELLRIVVAARPQLGAAWQLLAAASQRLGEEPPLEGELLDPGAFSAARYEELVRDAELSLYRAGDADRAVARLSRALTLRPGDALARELLIQAATTAGQPAALAELALQDLQRAEERGDQQARADAYEALARIDADMRGDRGSALLCYQSALAADPDRVWVMRALERAFVAEARQDELLGLRHEQATRIEPAADRVALHLDRARLGHRLGRPRADILADYSAAYGLDPRCRLALFHLESEARERGASAERAALELDIAAYFEDDAMARAAFLTRAGETLMDLGELDAAALRFQEASDAVGGYAPALFGWRVAALRGERFHDVAQAALREAEASPDDEERTALCHLAGVALMDGAGEGDAAVAALTAVLDDAPAGQSEPAQDDAFARLRVLFERAGRHEDLAALLSRRLDVESHPLARARLHRALAELARERGDGDGARQHLRDILEIVPGEPSALAMLSDLAWEQGAFEEAADALIARARTETDPGALKAIFTRLGVVYAEHLPDAPRAIRAFTRVLSLDAQDREALEHLSRLGLQTRDFKLALGACERLLKLDTGDDDRVAHLHRIAEIYADGLGDRARAERAYRTALDSAPTSDAALSALIRYYEESGDTRSLRVHLDRLIGAMRARLAEDASAGVPYRVIARALCARERAGVPGSAAAARSVAELALAFGAGEDEERALLAAAEAPPVARLATGDVDDLLFPPEVSGALRQLFGLLGERIAKHVGLDVRRHGVGRGDRLRGDEPALAVAQAMAAAMGIETPTVYLAQRDPAVLVAEPTSPISIVLGAALAARGDAAAMRFAVGRAIKLALTWFAVPARMSVDELGVLMVALLRQFEPEFTSPGVDEEAVSQQQQRLRRLIPSALIQELRPFAVGVAGSDFDHRAIWAGLEHTGNRAGLLACGSARAALDILCAMRGHADARAGAADPVIASLLRFVVSEDHVSLCALLAGAR